MRFSESFSYIGWNRDGSPSELRGQAIDFFLWKSFGRSIDRKDKLMGFLPNDQVLEGSCWSHFHSGSCLLTGCCPNRFPDSHLLVVQKSLFAAQKSFFDNSKASGSTANPKLALQAQTVGFAAQTVGFAGVTPR
jgi:hypothetical protein